MSLEMLLPYLLAALTLLLIVLAYMSQRAPGSVAERLQRLGGAPGSQPARNEPTTLLEKPEAQRATLAGITSRLAGSKAQTGSGEIYATIRQRLIEAGFRRPNALAVYMGSRVMLGAGLAAASIPLSWAFGGPPSVFVIFIAAAVGYILPGIVVDRFAVSRKEAIQRGLADAIDLMVVCVDAGLGLQSTMTRVAREFEGSEPLIAEELQITVAETQAGRGLMTALRGMAKRTGNQDLSNLVALLVQTERLGTPMSHALRTQAESMRFERMQLAEELAQKAPIKMMFPAGMIFLAILLVLGGPAFIMLSRAFES